MWKNWLVFFRTFLGDGRCCQILSIVFMVFLLTITIIINNIAIVISLIVTLTITTIVIVVIMIIIGIMIIIIRRDKTILLFHEGNSLNYYCNNYYCHYSYY